MFSQRSIDVPTVVNKELEDRRTLHPGRRKGYSLIYCCAIFKKILHDFEILLVNGSSETFGKIVLTSRLIVDQAYDACKVLVSDGFSKDTVALSCLGVDARSEIARLKSWHGCRHIDWIVL